MNRSRVALVRIGLAVAAAAAVAAFAVLRGSPEALENRDPTGERFPVVVGESLEKQRTEMPAAFAGAPAVLLIGYTQEAQFDIDRWLLGLIQAAVEARIVEVPTIPGLLPTFASGWIDDGMRSGIPREDWGSVVTLYGSAARPVAELTGTRYGRLTRVLVLDSEGRIAWFDDTGYSASKALAVAELVSRLGEA